ncbi:hypothetical protein [Massilia sp. ZL223]|uniref:phosphoribosyltransferase-like protein n=1 Tax=Massilia sp. ZL223 TaxID=2824904 RepID=UPI001B8341AA|nr:hypothetical protein [Massilia sp. ZL223]MBQ5964294.1 hypothetical protein [Massilia sp. ZL223]
MTLIKANSWLSSKADSLVELLMDDCSSVDEQTLITELLSRFKYISAENFVQKINDLVLDIVTIPGIEAKDTIIAAMAANSSPDSSQALVQNIKIKLQQNGWEEVQIVNAFGAAFKKLKADNFKRRNVILVDEFIGSGQTVLSRVAEIKRQFNTAQIDINVFVNVIFASISGIKKIEEAGIRLSYIESVSRGISDFETTEKIEEKVKSMLNIEKQLSPEHGEHKLSDYSLGYGKTESLIGFENSNIPNNVFPIFWWPGRSEGKSRNPLFTRYLGD